MTSCLLSVCCSDDGRHVGPREPRTHGQPRWQGVETETGEWVDFKIYICYSHDTIQDNIKYVAIIYYNKCSKSFSHSVSNKLLLYNIGDNFKCSGLYSHSQTCMQEIEHLSAY